MGKELAPLMDPDDAEAYTAGLGKVWGGGYELIAVAKRLRVPESLGLSTADWVQQRLGGYIRLSIEDRRAATDALRGEDARITKTDLAAILGVARGTIAADDKHRAENGSSDAPEGETPENDAATETETVSSDDPEDGPFEAQVIAVVETPTATGPPDDVTARVQDALSASNGRSRAPVYDAMMREQEAQAHLQPVYDIDHAVDRLFGLDPTLALSAWDATNTFDPLADTLRQRVVQIETYIQRLHAASEHRIVLLPSLVEGN